MFFLIYHAWDSSLWYKIGVTLVLLLGSPEPGRLIKSYEQYRKQFPMLHQ